MIGKPFGPQGLSILALVVAIFCYSSTPLFVRWISATGADPALVSLYRFAPLGLLMLPFLAFGGGRSEATIMGILAGIAIGVGWMGYPLAIDRIAVAPASVLYLSYPVFTLLFAWALLDRVPDVRSTISALMVIAALWLVITPELLASLNWQVGVLAFAPALSFGFAITVAAGWFGRLNTLQQLAALGLGAGLGPLPVVLLTRPMDAVLPRPDQFTMLAGLAVVTALIPAILYAVAAPRVGYVRSAVLGSFELPLIVFAAWLFLNEPVPERQFTATLAVVIAMMVVSLSNQPKSRPLPS